MDHQSDRHGPADRAESSQDFVDWAKEVEQRRAREDSTAQHRAGDRQRGSASTQAAVVDDGATPTPVPDDEGELHQKPRLAAQIAAALGQGGVTTGLILPTGQGTAFQQTALTAGANRVVDRLQCVMGQLPLPVSQFQPAGGDAQASEQDQSQMLLSPQTSNQQGFYQQPVPLSYASIALHSRPQAHMYTFTANAATIARQRAEASRHPLQGTGMPNDLSARSYQQTGTGQPVVRSPQNGDSSSYQRAREELGFSPPPQYFQDLNQERRTRSQRASAWTAGSVETPVPFAASTTMQHDNFSIATTSLHRESPPISPMTNRRSSLISETRRRSSAERGVRFSDEVDADDGSASPLAPPRNRDTRALAPLSPIAPTSRKPKHPRSRRGERSGPNEGVSRFSSPGRSTAPTSAGTPPVRPPEPVAPALQTYLYGPNAFDLHDTAGGLSNVPVSGHSQPVSSPSSVAPGSRNNMDPQQTASDRTWYNEDDGE